MGESKPYKLLQEVEASFLGMSKIEIFFLGALVVVVPMALRLATLLVSSSTMFAHGFHFSKQTFISIL
jgi:hypothetical protein